MSDRNTAKMPKPPRKTKMSNMEILRSRFKSAGKDGHSVWAYWGVSPIGKKIPAF
jgi:hypothetical protein